MDCIQLIGAEAVSRAGGEISASADSMRQTAGHLDESLRMFLTRFEELVVRLESAIEEKARG